MSEWILEIKDGSFADHEYVCDEWHRIELNLNDAKMIPLIRCRDCKEFGLEEGEEPPTLEHCRKYVQFGGIREVDPNGLCAWAEPKEEA
jgi:hypothetical protein